MTKKAQGLTCCNVFALIGHVMTVKSAGHLGDQVSLTSVLYEFDEPVCITLDYYLQESKPRASGSLSVYLLTKHRVPLRLHLEEQNAVISGDWKRGCVYIPTGTYHVMFLATLGLPYYSDIYLDNISLGHRDLCYRPVVKPTGNILSC